MEYFDLVQIKDGFTELFKISTNGEWSIIDKDFAIDVLGTYNNFAAKFGLAECTDCRTDCNQTANDNIGGDRLPNGLIFNNPIMVVAKAWADIKKLLECNFFDKTLGLLEEYTNILTPRVSSVLAGALTKVVAENGFWERLDEYLDFIDSNEKWEPRERFLTIQMIMQGYKLPKNVFPNGYNAEADKIIAKLDEIDLRWRVIIWGTDVEATTKYMKWASLDLRKVFAKHPSTWDMSAIQQAFNPFTISTKELIARDFKFLRQ
jgi:hypothetical protein